MSDSLIPDHASATPSYWCTWGAQNYAVDADMISHWPAKVEPIDSSRIGQRRAFNGLCQLILKTTDTAGSIRIRANATGLHDGETTVASMQARRRPWVH